MENKNRFVDNTKTLTIEEIAHCGYPQLKGLPSINLLVIFKTLILVPF